LAQAGGTLTLRANRGVHIQTQEGDRVTNTAVQLHAQNGAVSLYGGGKLKGPDADLNPERQPGLQLGGDGVEVQSSDFVKVTAASAVTVNSPNSVDVSGNQYLRLSGGQKAALIAEEVSVHASGKLYQTISGPLHNDPSNGALRETVFATSSTGVIDHYSIPQVGDRLEEINVGSHQTSIQVGNLTFQTQQGNATLKAGTNQVTLDSNSGLSANVQTGDILLQTTGSGTLSANGNIRVNSESGSVVVRGSSAVYLSSTGGKVGGIVSGADIDPLTGLPLQTLGLGSPKHLLSAT